MADTGRDARILTKLREYVNTIETNDYDLDAPRNGQAYEKDLSKTLQELKKQYSQEIAKLENLRLATGPPIWDEVASDPRTRLRQVQLITSAFRSLADSEARLPTAGSQIPALLAARETQRLAVETKEAIPVTLAHLEKVRKDLAEEQADLLSSTRLKQGLEKREASLREQQIFTAKQTTEERMQIFLVQEQEQAKQCKRDHKKLTAALVRFVESKLAPLIAAEELGGPVAGSTLDISEDVLAAGFDAKGKKNKAAKKLRPDTRQQRLDKIFASARGEDDGDMPESETAQAALAVKDLLGDLLQVAVDHGSGRYVTMDKETAASRFLVRVKAAELHPKDARRIRLVDFAKTLDD